MSPLWRHNITVRCARFPRSHKISAAWDIYMSKYANTWIQTNVVVAEEYCSHALRWVHTCNVTMYYNAITLHETDTVRSYKLNFHPSPHGNSNLRVLHIGDPSLLQKPEWCLCSQKQLRTFIYVTFSVQPFLFKKGCHWCCVSINSMTLPSVHSISQLQKCSRNHTTLQIRTTLQDRSISNEKKGRGANSGDMTHCISTHAQAVTIPSPLWCNSQILKAHLTSLYCYRVTNFWYITWSRVPSTLSQYGVTVRGNVTSVYPP
jgi:hypothetical protein